MVSLSQLQKALICLVLTFSSICTAQELSTFRENNLYGYKRGNSVLIPAKFKYAADFHNNRAAVLLNKKWGYIDEKGTLVIPAEMDRAENFQYGFARFYQNGKIGLMDTMGKKIVPAICDKIDTWDGNRWDLKSGKEEGHFLLESQLYIPPVYKSIDRNENFIVCETANNHFDIYLRNPDTKTVIRNVEQKPVMTNYYNTIYCDITLNGKTEIIDQSAKVISGKYNGISRVNVNVDHKIGESSKYYSQVYLLQLGEGTENVFDAEGNVIPSKFHLFFDENYQFTDAVYTDFASDEGNYRITVRKDSLPGHFDDSGRLVFSKYCREVQSGDYALLYYKDNSVDIVRYQYSFASDVTLTDTIIKYHFPYAEKVLIGDSIREFTNEVIMEYFEFTRRAEGLFQIRNDSGEYALFQADRGIFLTPFSPRSKMVMGYESFDHLFLVYQESDGSLYFSMDGNISEKPVGKFENLNGNYLIYYQDGTKELFRIRTNTRIVIPEKYGLLDGRRVYNYLLADEMKKTDWNYDDSWFQFNFDLIVVYDLEKKDGLYGFITKSNTIVEPRFCEIEPLIEYSPESRNHIVQTRIGDKFGWYNYDHDVFVECKYYKRFNEVMLSGSQNAIELDSTLWMSVFGTPLPRYNIEYDFYNGKYAGVASENSEQEEPVLDTIVPPVFVSVEGLDNNIYLVQNKKGSFGLYNSFGDCILEPKYSSITEPESMPLDQRFYIFEEGGKKGILETKYWVQTPAIYDDIIFKVLENNLHDDIRENELVIIVKEGSSISTLSNELSPLQSGFDFILLFDDYDRSAFVQMDNKLGLVDYLSNDAPDLKRLTKEFDFIFDGYSYLKTGDSLKQFDLYSMAYLGVVSEPEFRGYFPKAELIFNGKTVEFVNRKNRKVIWSTNSRFIQTSEGGWITFFENGQLQIFNTRTKKIQNYYENN